MTNGDILENAENLIRAARERSNLAIAAHDLAGIAREWMDDFHMLGSTGARASGHEANVQFFARQFERRPDSKYVRTPTSIAVFAPWAVAAERGDWVATWTESDGPLRIGGTYQAQWRMVEGRWLIQGELFVPSHCDGGAYCARHP